MKSVRMTNSILMEMTELGTSLAHLRTTKKANLMSKKVPRASILIKFRMTQTYCKA